MDRWTAATAPLPGEVSLALYPRTTLYNGDDCVHSEPSTLALTNYRLLWGGQLALDLSLVARVASKQSFMASPKSILYLTAPAESTAQPQPWTCAICAADNESAGGKCRTCGVAPKRPWACPACTFVNEAAGPCRMCGLDASRPPGVSDLFCKIAFKDSGSFGQFQSLLERTVAAKAWLGPSSTRPAGAPAMGISGLLQQQAQQQKQASETLSDAFCDIDHLMSKAEAMVALAGAITEKIRQKTATDEREVTEEEAAEFKTILADLGVQGFISRESKGYQVELARQLAVVAEKLLRLRRCDMMPLTDLFCFYNRSRGTDMCSPADCVEATRLWPGIGGVDVACRQFGDILVVQSVRHDDAQVQHRLLQHLSDDTMHVTALTWSTLTNVPLLIATAQLREAERAGRVCRDESLGRVAFYANRILTQ